MVDNKWNTPQFQRIVNVDYVDGDLLVKFEDGAIVRADSQKFQSPGIGNLAWKSLHYDNNQIIVPSPSGDVQIPWSTIRLLSDEKFAEYWAGVAEDEAKRIGYQIKELRVRKGLSSKEVAERAGITPQSLSRIERGHHDVVFTTLRKILAVMGYSLTDLENVQTQPISLNFLVERLEKVGIRKDWIFQRFIPVSLIEKINNEPNSSSVLEELASYIARIFNWPVDQVLSTSPLTLNRSVVQTAAFKSYKRTNESQASAYAIFAHYLANITLDAVPSLGISIPSADPDNLREIIAKNYGRVDLETTLRFIWDLGIPVIPLEDAGSFYGACWKIENRSVIILKQLTHFHGRWLFDLLHEYLHVAKHLDERQSSIIEIQEIIPFDNSTDEEWEASEFAIDVLLYGRAEELAEKAVEFAKNKVELLKSAVIRVATSERIPIDVFANYMAYRLSDQNQINWWGAANNLQITEPYPIEIARKIYAEKVDLEKLNELDRDLIKRAVLSN